MAGDAVVVGFGYLVDDGLPEGNETVNLTLSNPTGGATLGTPRAAVLTILDDEVGLRFSAPTYTVNENGGLATITVVRTGPTASPVSVNYATSDGSAIAGTDYTQRSGTLSFAAGVTSQVFTVPILNNTRVNGNRTVTLALGSPGGGALLGTPS